MAVTTVRTIPAKMAETAENLCIEDSVGGNNSGGIAAIMSVNRFSCSFAIEWSENFPSP